MYRATTPIRPCQRRVWYLYPYMLPADVLSPEPTHDTDPSSLREAASCEGACYVRVLRAFGDGTYLARVAATPGFNPYREGYTLVLTEAQLSQARPWTWKQSVRPAWPHVHSERTSASWLAAKMRQSELVDALEVGGTLYGLSTLRPH